MKTLNAPGDLNISRVLRLIWQIKGISRIEIAQQLGISYRTVEIHRTQILKKTGMSNFLELARQCETSQISLDNKH